MNILQKAEKLIPDLPGFIETPLPQWIDHVLKRYESITKENAELRSKLHEKDKIIERLLGAENA